MLNKTSKTFLLCGCLLSLPSIGFAVPRANCTKGEVYTAPADTSAANYTVTGAPKEPMKQYRGDNIRDAAMTFRHKGKEQFSAQDFQGAIHSFSRSLAAEPGHAGTLFNLALSLENAGQLKDAALTYEKARRVSGDTHATYRAGMCWYQLGEYPRALRLFETLSVVMPSLGEAWKMKGFCQKNLQQPHEARDSFRVGLALLPQDGEIIRAMHEILGLLGEKEDEFPVAEELSSPDANVVGVAQVQEVTGDLDVGLYQDNSANMNTGPEELPDALPQPAAEGTEDASITEFTPTGSMLAEIQPLEVEEFEPELGVGEELPPMPEDETGEVAVAEKKVDKPTAPANIIEDAWTRPLPKKLPLPNILSEEVVLASPEKSHVAKRRGANSLLIPLEETYSVTRDAPGRTDLRETKALEPGDMSPANLPGNLGLEEL